MIRYALKCNKEHAFESWFQSASAFDDLVGAGMLACPVCDSSQISKTLMAPSVSNARKAAKAAPDERGPLQQPASPQEEALVKLRHEIETKSEYVGPSFATEARRIHDGTSPERAIHGEARIDEAKKLLEDGVPVMPLPFLPSRKTN